MMMGLPALLCAALFAQVATTGPNALPTTDPAATSPAASEAAALVMQLLGEDPAARETATQALLNIGDDAAAALQSARAAARDPDAQVRLDTLLVQVKERADVGATKVTLKYDDTPIDIVIASLAKQARTDFAAENLVNEFGGQTLPRISIDLHDVSFWTAIRELQTSGGIVFLPQGDNWRVSKNFGQLSVIQGDESGAFLVQPLSASYQRTINYVRSMGDGGERFYVQFQALCEPKVKLANGMGTVTLDRAVDSNGNDLLAPQRFNQIQTGNGQNVIMCSMPLKYPKNAGATIAEIRGTMKMSIARRTETLASEDLAADHHLEKIFEGVKVRIDVSAAGSVANGIGFSIKIDSAGDLAATQRLQQNFQNRVRVTDAKGAPLGITGFNAVRSDGRSSEFLATYASQQPQQSSGPYKLRIEVPTGFRQLELPFVMHEMKMP